MPFSWRTPTVNLPTSVSHPPIAYIVDDALAALQAIAHWHRLHATRPDLRVIGITGSVGKSSTKELMGSVLRQRYRTLNNEGSLNSEQGLPFTLLGLDAAYERAILEMGMYLIGDIQELCALGHPHVGVVTNVQPVHLSRAGTIERIAEGKSELVQALPSETDGGVAIRRDRIAKGSVSAIRFGCKVWHRPHASLLGNAISGL